MGTDQLQADRMVGVLVDACGWASLVDAGVNLDIALSEVVGEAKLKITGGVKKELDRLSESRSGLLLDLLYSRSEIIEDENGHTDDALLSISAKMSWPVLTVDRGLKRRLVSEGCSYIEVTSGSTLRLVGP
ncbi:MAG: hypothetical protein CMB67_01290 [Euryarchaeota archaeon]|nr:hypothetical protein [Euryarchaeota archaeon]